MERLSEKEVVGKDIIDFLIGLKSSAVSDCKNAGYDDYTIKQTYQMKLINKTIEIIEAMEKAEVPEPKTMEEIINAEGKNLYIPIIAKKDLDIKHWGELYTKEHMKRVSENERWKKDYNKQQLRIEELENIISQNAVKDKFELISENTELKQQIEKITSKDFGMAQLITENNELKQRVKELEEIRNEAT